MLEMTYNEAIRIHKSQVDFYVGFFTDAKRAELARMTKPCPFNPDKMRPVIEINRLVPRGRAIEKLCGLGK